MSQNPVWKGKQAILTPLGLTVTDYIWGGAAHNYHVITSYSIHYTKLYEADLVVRYEYAPGFDEIDALSAGGQAHYWFGDHVRVGLIANTNEQDGEDST